MSDRKTRQRNVLGPRKRLGSDMRILSRSRAQIGAGARSVNPPARGLAPLRLESCELDPREIPLEYLLGLLQPYPPPSSADEQTWSLPLMRGGLRGSGLS